MTTVERYRLTQLEDYIPASSDALSNATRSPIHSVNTVGKGRYYVPPAAPSPPTHSTRQYPPQNPHSRRPFDSPPRKPPQTEYTTAEMSNELSQWLFTDTEMQNTPSIMQGLTVVEERCRRAKGVNFIFQAGILLKLPQLTLATASVFFHRFYMRFSMIPEKTGLHHYSSLDLASKDPRAQSLTFDSLDQNIAATALFLATKTEENCRKTKEIVIAVAKVAQKNASLIIDEQSKEYWRWRDNILLYEELMLELLTFDVVLTSPYHILYDSLRRLQIANNKDVRNVAWSFLNDSCMSTMCLSISPRQIAVAAIYFAIKFRGENIPDENGLPWWKIIGGDEDKIAKAVGLMNDFYRENPLKKSGSPYEQSPFSYANGEDLERTRSREQGSSGEQASSGAPSPEEINEPVKQSEIDTSGSSEETKSSATLPASHRENNNSSLLEEAKGLESTLPVPLQALDPPGSSDAALKEAANDPATHQPHLPENDISKSLDIPAPDLRPSPKRKAEDIEESPTKRVRSDDTEEGEVE
ncbi:hypothetical protein B7494_g7430 [Chlorociboria aeruginascens]|nr:hypothetical protein B7494_g7430 [Chlorociboria aeruginascens]